MALARALGPANVPQQAPLPVKLEDIPAWAETVLFGSAPDLRRLLDQGLDPNSATSRGGTTALMMAVPDLAKMKLLLDHGANINARTRTKYSALMVATQHRDSTASIQLLLKRGAEVRMPEGQGAPSLNAHPFMPAAYAGNTEVLRTLRDAGEKADGKMVLAGIADWTPLNGRNDAGRARSG